MIPKTRWRQILLARRKAISKERRIEAAKSLREILSSRPGKILSFSPIGSEIDISFLNNALLAQGRLSLVPCQDAQIDVSLFQVDCILVPGLGFDRDRYRIGYGKGHYDRFLAEVKETHTIGVGFKEQFCEELFPKDPWDIPLKELVLV